MRSWSPPHPCPVGGQVGAPLLISWWPGAKSGPNPLSSPLTEKVRQCRAGGPPSLGRGAGVPFPGYLGQRCEGLGGASDRRQWESPAWLALDQPPPSLLP